MFRHLLNNIIKKQALPTLYCEENFYQYYLKGCTYFKVYSLGVQCCKIGRVKGKIYPEGIYITVGLGVS